MHCTVAVPTLTLYSCHKPATVVCFLCHTHRDTDHCNDTVSKIIFRTLQLIPIGIYWMGKLAHPSLAAVATDVYNDIEYHLSLFRSIVRYTRWCHCTLKRIERLSQVLVVLD